MCLLIPAYYGVYAYAGGLRRKEAVANPKKPAPPAGSAEPQPRMAIWRIAAGWIAAIFFICIGFLFANGLSLMDHVGRWPELWEHHSLSGAALGTALNIGDATLLPRWLMMFGLALGTTAVWLLVDVFFLTGNNADDAYRSWAVGFARKLYTVAMIWVAAAGTWYLSAHGQAELRGAMFAWPLVALTVVTAVATGLPWTLMMIINRYPQRRLLVAAIALCAIWRAGHQRI